MEPLVKNIRTGRKILLRVKEVAAFLGVSEDMIYDWVSKRKIPFIKFGRLVKLRKEDLDTLLKSCPGQSHGREKVDTEKKYIHISRYVYTYR